MMLGGHQSRSGCCGAEKNLAFARNQILTIQPVAGRYTDSIISYPNATLTPLSVLTIFNLEPLFVCIFTVYGLF
jgi:hypothetical protein